MKNFIEVTTIKDEVILLNINLIFEISTQKGITQLKIASQGSNGFPYQYYKVKNSYEDIKALIDNKC